MRRVGKASFAQRSDVPTERRQRFDDTTIPPTISANAMPWYTRGASPRNTVDMIAAKTGAKVWVIVRRSGDELTTQTYGVIRDP